MTPSLVSLFAAVERWQHPTGMSSYVASLEAQADASLALKQIDIPALRLLAAEHAGAVRVASAIVAASAGKTESVALRAAADFLDLGTI